MNYTGFISDLLQPSHNGLRINRFDLGCVEIIDRHIFPFMQRHGIAFASDSPHIVRSSREHMLIPGSA